MFFSDSCLNYITKGNRYVRSRHNATLLGTREERTQENSSTQSASYTDVCKSGLEVRRKGSWPKNLTDRQQRSILYIDTREVQGSWYSCTDPGIQLYRSWYTAVQILVYRCTDPGTQLYRS